LAVVGLRVVGTAVGLAVVGTAVGATVGTAVGTAVVGTAVGTAVGVAVGARDAYWHAPLSVQASVHKPVEDAVGWYAAMRHQK